MSKLKILMKPCSGGSCPAIYEDAQGRVFVQGSKLSAAARTTITVGGHEEVVEVSPELLSYLRSNQV